MKHFKVFFKTRNPIRELFPDKNKPIHFWQCTHRDTIEGGGGGGFVSPFKKSFEFQECKA